jgi:hypothetical protein
MLFPTLLCFVCCVHELNGSFGEGGGQRASSFSFFLRYIVLKRAAFKCPEELDAEDLREKLQI